MSEFSKPEHRSNAFDHLEQRIKEILHGEDIKIFFNNDEECKHFFEHLLITIFWDGDSFREIEK